MFKNFNNIHCIKFENNIISIHYHQDSALHMHQVHEHLFELTEFIDFLTDGKIDAEALQLNELMGVQELLLQRLKQAVDQVLIEVRDTLIPCAHTCTQHRRVLPQFPVFEVECDTQET